VQPSYSQVLLFVTVSTLSFYRNCTTQNKSMVLYVEEIQYSQDRLTQELILKFDCTLPSWLELKINQALWKN